MHALPDVSTWSTAGELCACVCICLVMQCTFPTHRLFKDPISFYLQSAPAGGKAVRDEKRKELERQRRGGGEGGGDTVAAGRPSPRVDGGRTDYVKKKKKKTLFNKTKSE